MSNAKQETIADIVREMREGVVADGWMEQTLREFADRIEAAEKHSVTNCNRLGNAARMREALKQILDRVNSLDEDCGVDPVEIRDIARTTLAAPSRNCDRFSNANEALEAFEKEKGETMIEFIRWLFAETKGGAK